MTDKEKLEILKKICIENICCKDCKALGIYDDCNSPRILKCEQLAKGVVEEVFSNLEKENEQLKAQIEKMKFCGNCKHFNFNEPNYCNKGVFRERQYGCSKWELAE